MNQSDFLHILIIEDSSESARLARVVLEQAGMACTYRRVETGTALHAALEEACWDAVLAGYRLRHFSGLQALQVVRAHDREVPFVFVSGTISEDQGAHAMQQGANDYVSKHQLVRLPVALRRELREARLRRESRVTARMFRDILNGANEAIISVDDSWRLIVFNRGAEIVFGYRADEILGKPLGQLLPERLRANHHRLSREFAVGDRDVLNLNDRRSELLGVRKDGSEFPAEINVFRSVTTDGETTYTAMLRDITARRESERALRESEMRFRLLVSNIKDYAIFMRDRDGRIQSWNEGARQLMGYRAEESIGNTMDSFCTEQDRVAGVPSRLFETARREGWAEDQGWRIRKDGSRFYANVIVTRMLDDAGTLIGFTQITRDVSEHKHLEDALTQHADELEKRVRERTAELELARQDAERLAQSKSEFLANMSHEIRTPMNAVLTLAYLLEQHDLPEETRDLARKIHRAGQTLLNSINDILDFSRIESGRLELEQVPFRLDSVLDILATIMSATASGKKLELSITPPRTSSRYLLHGDSHRLGQVLINLTNNAIKFTDQGMVEVRIEQMAYGQDRVTLEFSVRDTGIGIAPQDQALLFQPFAQADASITRRYGGTGLGLAISRRLLQSMGGELKLSSKPGEGSVFSFELEFETSPFPAESPLERAPDMTTLVVDDNPITREGAMATVASLGWSTLQAETGGQTLQLVMERAALRGPNAVILLDWCLPDMDGLATAEAICTALPIASRPLLLVFTAHARGEFSDDRRLAYVDAVLDKPLSPTALHDAVNRAYDRRLQVLAESQPDSVIQGPAQLGGLRLLVVDDSEINRDVAERVFTGAGATVALAEDGRQALDWLHSHADDVDLVLMDVQMPGMDGYQVTRQIRQSSPLAALPVVALTAGALEEQKSAAIDAGMDAFLSKPFNIPEAIATVRRLTGRAPEPVQADSESTTAADHGALPGLALARGIAVWQDADRYRQYLRKFANDFGDSARAIAAAGPETAAQLAHKLKGAAGNLALETVAACAGELEQCLAHGEDGTILIATLQDALDQALESIDRYAPEPATDDPATPRPLDAFDRSEVGRLLDHALTAFARFDPASVEPVLQALAEQLPAERIFSMRRAIEDFDAGAGAVAVRSLAEDLAIELKE